ncbi:hypothetical protein ACIQMR_33505 [Streptomyces sp. NPDC091376]|uniref:hypothetical protein n=1 Tax=Streptomyces sp. NPDC091376 TaxID=3365994 RepID=UPI0038007AE8
MFELVVKDPEALNDPAGFAAQLAGGDPIDVWAGLWGLTHPGVGRPLASPDQVAEVIRELVPYPEVGRTVFELAVTQAPALGRPAAAARGTAPWLGALAQADPEPVVTVLAGMAPATAGWVLAQMAAAHPGGALAVLPDYVNWPGADQAVAAAVCWDLDAVTKVLAAWLTGQTHDAWARWLGGHLAATPGATAGRVLARIAAGQGGQPAAAGLLVGLYGVAPITAAQAVRAAVTRDPEVMVPVLTAAIADGTPAAEVLCLLDTFVATAVVAALPAGQAVHALQALELTEADKEITERQATRILLAAMHTHPVTAAHVAGALLDQGRIDDVTALLIPGEEVSAGDAATVFAAVTWPDQATAVRVFTAMTAQDPDHGDAPDTFTTTTATRQGGPDPLAAFGKALNGGYGHRLQLLRLLDEAGDVHAAALALAAIAAHDPADAEDMLDLLLRGQRALPALPPAALLTAALQARPRELIDAVRRLASHGENGTIQLLAEVLTALPLATAGTLYAGVAAAADAAGDEDDAGTLDAPGTLLAALHRSDAARATEILTHLLAIQAPLAVRLCVWLAEHGTQVAGTVAAILVVGPPANTGKALAALATHDLNLFTLVHDELTNLAPAAVATAVTALAATQTDTAARLLSALHRAHHTDRAAATLAVLAATHPHAPAQILAHLTGAALMGIVAALPQQDLTTLCAALLATNDVAAVRLLLNTAHRVGGADRAAATLAALAATHPHAPAQIVDYLTDAAVAGIVTALPQGQLITLSISLMTANRPASAARLLSALHRAHHTDRAAATLAALAATHPHDPAQIVMYLVDGVLAELVAALPQRDLTALFNLLATTKAVAAVRLLQALPHTDRATAMLDALGATDPNAAAEIQAAWR